MNPVAAVVLPAAALVLAGTTVSAVPALPAGPDVQAVPPAPSRSHQTPHPRIVLESGPGRTSERALPESAETGGRPISSPAPRGRWTWPLKPQPAVVRPFLRPATKYGAGHRGVDLAGAPAQLVLAVEAGTVTHVGPIAGRGTVTVLHSSGIRSTYEPVDPLVVTGSAVSRGGSLGRLEASGSHCGPAACLHLGAIRGAVYLDPMAFIVGGRGVRLLPLGQAPEG